MASVGVRVEPTVRLGRVGRVWKVHLDSFLFEHIKIRESAFNRVVPCDPICCDILNSNDSWAYSQVTSYFVAKITELVAALSSIAGPLASHLPERMSISALVLFYPLLISLLPHPRQAMR
jgi:hypothetical protein